MCSADVSDGRLDCVKLKEASRLDLLYLNSNDIVPGGQFERLEATLGEAGKNFLPGAKSALTDNETFLVPFGQEILGHSVAFPVPKIVENLGLATAVGFAAKKFLPENGFLGKIGAIGLGAYFLVPAVKSISNSCNDGMNAQTMPELRAAGKELGLTASSLAVNSIVGSMGYKFGSGLACKANLGELVQTNGPSKFRDCKPLTSEATELLSNKTPELSSQITSLVKLYAKEGKEEDLTKTLANLLKPTRAEDGCIGYELYKDPNQAGHLMLCENWRDQGALDLHLKSPHMIDFFKRSNDLLDKPPEFSPWKVVPEP